MCHGGSGGTGAKFLASLARSPARGRPCRLRDVRSRPPMSTASLWLPAEERETIAAAGRAAEARTAAELVVYVVPRCDGYAHALWKGAALGSVGAALGLAAVARLGQWWGAPVEWTALATGAGAALGYLAALTDPVRRWLATPEVMEQRARERAAEAFLDAQVFRTRERTGVLLFFALFERWLVVLADEGVTGRVAAADWDDTVARVAAEMRAQRAAPAILTAIGLAGELLAARGLAPRPDDANELPDAPRLEEEE